MYLYINIVTNENISVLNSRDIHHTTTSGRHKSYTDLILHYVCICTCIVTSEIGSDLIPRDGYILNYVKTSGWHIRINIYDNGYYTCLCAHRHRCKRIRSSLDSK